jgi:hypothetical protein
LLRHHALQQEVPAVLREPLLLENAKLLRPAVLRPWSELLRQQMLRG